MHTASRRNTARNHDSREASPPRAGPPRRPTSWWQIAAAWVTALALGLGALALVRTPARPLALLLAAIVLVAWPGHRRPRALAIGPVYLVLLLTSGGIARLLLPALIERAWGAVARFDRLASIGLGNALQGRASRSLGAMVSLSLTIVSSLLATVPVLGLSAYRPIATPALRQFFQSLPARRHRRRVDAVPAEIGGTPGGYVRGVAIASPIGGAIVSVGLLVIGVDYPLGLALVAGLGGAVPILGPISGAVPALEIALLDSPTQALVVLVFFVVVQRVEGNLVAPHITRSQTDLPALLTLLARLVDGAIGGVLWKLVVIPVVGALRVLVPRVVAPAVRGRTGAGATAGRAREEGGA